MMLRRLLAVAFSLLPIGSAVPAQDSAAGAILFEDVRIFDGRTPQRSATRHVLVRGNRIERISSEPLVAPEGATVIAAGGRTLMPGLIDAHTHILFATLPQAVALTSDLGFMTVAAVRTAEDWLMQGFTSVRDLGGPALGLKRGIDQGLVPGPRIWASGAMISQTGGHGDFRLPTEMPAPPGSFTYAERIGATAIADGPDEVRKRVREQLALGASQIKLMAGGGVSSHYDPLDVTQFSVDELRAAVEAAENWGTYVTVHAYTPRAVRQAIEAGVRCIDHGHLLDEATVRLMAERGVWWSLQPFTEDESGKRFPEGSPNWHKEREVRTGTARAFELARKHGVRLAYGTDVLFSAQSSATLGRQLLKLTQWLTPAEILVLATSTNAELLALSGPRNPYPGTLGVIEEGALADLLLVEGDPLADLALLADPHRTLRVIVKDGRVHKNTLP